MGGRGSEEIGMFISEYIQESQLGKTDTRVQLGQIQKVRRRRGSVGETRGTNTDRIREPWYGVVVVMSSPKI